MSITYTGSLYFGPEPDATRFYSHQFSATPAGGAFTLFWLGVRIDRAWTGDDPAAASATYITLWGSANGTTNGNDSWLMVRGVNDGAGIHGRIVFRLAVAGTVGASGTSASLAIDYHSTWSFALASDGANWNLYGCTRGGTVQTLATGTWNAAFGTARTTLARIGRNAFGGRIQAVGMCAGAISDTDFEAIANGTDPETLIAEANRRDFIELSSPAATLTNAWSANHATQAGTWTGRPTSSPLIPNAAAYIDCAEPRPYSVVAMPWGGGNGSLVLTGTYAGFTAAATFQARLVLSSNVATVAQDWTDLTAFSVDAGAWTGTLSVPAGGEYVIQVRDKDDNTKVWNGGNPIVCAPVITTDGQSPMAYMQTVGKNSVTVTGTGYLAQYAYDAATFCIAKASTVNAGAGFAAMINRWSALSGTVGLFIIPAAVSGTSSTQWAAVDSAQAAALYARLDAAGVPKHTSIWWLNGASESGADIPGNHNTILSNYDTALGTTRGITYKRVMVPHNRDTANGSIGVATRVAQRAWALAHAEYGTKVFVGPDIADIQMDADSLGTGTVTSADATHVTLTGQTYTYTTSHYIKIVSGTGAGQVRQFTAVNNTTKVYTVATWTVTPDATSTFRTFGTSPHQNAAGSVRAGSRFGQAAAKFYGFTATTANGPSLTSAVYPVASTEIEARLTHVHGTALRTINGGSVFGFEGWNGSAWVRPTAATITGAATVGLTFAAATSKIRYGHDGGAPVTAADYEYLGDLLYDNSGIGDTAGLPVWFTQADVNTEPGLVAGELSVDETAADSVTLSWTDATGDANTAQLQRRVPAGEWGNVSGATTSPATDSTVSSNTAYEYRVAYTSALTVYSDAVPVSTLPATPTGLAIRTGDTHLIADWDANTDSPDGYRLYRDAVEVYEGAATTHLDDPLVNGTEYEYTVTAYDGARESGASAAVAGTPGTGSGGVYPATDAVDGGVQYGPTGTEYTGTGMTAAQVQTAITNALAAAGVGASKNVAVTVRNTRVSA